ncbi:sulfatase [Pontiellaceae bacterium B1224]|nr:sulfatase [Pontiellaceae bacterium B1224]
MMKCVGLILLLMVGSAMARPNIVYITVDDLGIMDVGFNSTRYLTPSLYRLCAEGTVFSEAYAAAANCAPSRASVMSGQYTPRHGVYTVGSSERGPSNLRKLIPTENTEFLSLDNVTIAEVLQKRGYATMHVGKWHLGEDPTQQGFDVNMGGDKFGSPKGGYFSPFTQESMKVFNDRYPTGTHRVEIFTDQAINFMQIHREEPFFIHLSYYSVHTPLEEVPKMVNKYDGSKVNRAYASMIEKVDQGVGLILEALDRLHLTSNTLVVFTSDNGGVCSTSSQAPFRAGKGSYFDGGIRVPLIVRWPGHAAAANLCEVPVSGIDLYPTFLEAAELRVPRGKVLDGVSLVPLFEKWGEIPERPLFWHFPVYLEKYAGKEDGAHDADFRTRPGSAVRLGKWKLHEYFEDGRLELYDLGADPAERMNFAAIHPEKTAAMHKLLVDWRAELNAPVPTELNPDYDPEAVAETTK